MAAVVTKKGAADDVPMHHIRITLSSRNVKSLEKGSSLNHRQRCFDNCISRERLFIASSLSFPFQCALT